MTRSVSAFDTFVAGAACFLAGIAVSGALESTRWTRGDVVLLGAALVLLSIGAGRLRALYRAQPPAAPSSDRGAAA